MFNDSSYEIKRLLDAPESEHLEFKEAKNRYDFEEMVKYCCALANRGGGKFVLGISDKRPRKVVGSSAFEQPEQTRRALMDRLRIGVDFRAYDSEGKRVLVFEIASRPIGLPVAIKGVAWWREGDSLIPMPEEVRHRIYMESGHDFSADICVGAVIGDLDSLAIETFRTIWAEHSKNTRIEAMSAEQLLRDAAVITDGGITNAALILFGKHESLRKFLPHTEIIFEYRSFESAGPANQREDLRKGFFGCFDRIWELVNLRNDKQHYQKKFQLLPIDTFNERVVREAVLNAVSHRDYQMSGSIFVRQYQTRLVVESPGGFPKGITVDNILDKHAPRNRLIADVFQLCGIVERAGQGMNLIFEMAVKEAKPLPNFKGSDAYFTKLTLEGKVFSEKALAFIKKTDEKILLSMSTEDYLLLARFFTLEAGEYVKHDEFDSLINLGLVRQTEIGFELIDTSVTIMNGVQSLDAVAWQSLEISEQNGRILEFIANSEKVTTAQVAEFIGKSPSYTRGIMQKLAKLELIEKHGDNRFATYSINHNRLSIDSE